MESREIFHLAIHDCTHSVDGIACSIKKEAARRQEEKESGYRLFCFVGDSVDFSTVHEMQTLLSGKKSEEGELLLWRRKQNSRAFLFFRIALMLSNCSCFALAYWLLFCFVCEEAGYVDCLFYAFPLCTLFCMGVIVLSNIYLMRKKLVLQTLFTVENKCMFHGISQHGQRAELNMNVCTESKRYDSHKTFPVTVLYYHDASHVKIKMAFFHLPAETRWHQPIGCDVMDQLRMDTPKMHRQISILVAFCYDVSAAAMEDFVFFLEKSKFTVQFRGHPTVIVAIREETFSRKSPTANIRQAIIEPAWTVFESSDPHVYESVSNGILSISLPRREAAV